MFAYVQHIHSGKIIRWGFGGPWMKGKPSGQLSLFMIWTEYWVDGDVEFASVNFSTGYWRKYLRFAR